ncbi:MAG: LemA family protein [Eubacteriales bacterium]|nr:LemA family protein [Eubacteriales bacterium]
MKGKTGLTILAIVAAVILILVIVSISSCNGLIDSQENVESMKSNVQVDLQRRADLIPNLVSTVKAYAQHEEEIFTAIADARAAMMSAGTVAEMNDASQQMDSAISRLLAISEAYPELKSNENFIALQDELSGTENEIKRSRTKYNEAAQAFNSKIRRFPGVIFAGIMGMEKVDYFEASAGSLDVPVVDFGD